MKKRIIYGSIAAFIIIAIAVLIRIYGPTNDSHTISLPSPAVESGGNIDSDSINRVEITPQTVKTVLGTLARADSFSRTYTIKTFWNGGESESTLNYWQKGDSIRLSVSQNGTTQNILVLGNELYVWYDGASGVFRSKLSESSVSREVDRFSSLVTYEEIMNTPQEDIIEASYVEQSGKPCILVKYKSGELNYVNQVCISIDSGLLVFAKKYDGDNQISSMESVSTELSTPSDDLFKLPS